jgi:hypothetical protein
MPYSTADGRQQLLESVAEAGEALASALASLTEAYEQLDEAAADRVEEQLFRPVQRAYGRARNAYTGFAERHELASRAFREADRAAPSHGVKGLIEAAGADVVRADGILSTLQDSLLPIEVGDSELRAQLEQVRALLPDFNSRARELMRTFGR